MGRMDVLSNGLDTHKLDANSSKLSPGLDAWTMNGSAQSEIILSGQLDYKRYSLRYSYLDTWTINGTV